MAIQHITNVDNCFTTSAYKKVLIVIAHAWLISLSSGPKQVKPDLIFFFF